MLELEGEVLDEPELELGEVLLGLDEEPDDEPDIEEDDGEVLDPPEDDGLVLEGELEDDDEDGDEGLVLEGELDMEPLVEPELAPGCDVPVLLPPVLLQP